MAFESLFLAIEESSIGSAMRESAVLFPLVECIHVVGLVFVVGSIVTIDLRLLWLSAREYAVTKMSTELLPWTWGAFALTAVSGVLLFCTSATTYATNIAFQIKILLIIAAGLNMMIFHFITWKKVHEWDMSPPPTSTKVAGGLSLLFWVLVVGFGRWIGFI